MIFSLDETRELIVSKLDMWVDNFLGMLPNFVLAVLIVVIFVMLAKFWRKLIGRILERFSDHVAINKLVENIIYIVILLVGIFAALSILELDKTVTSLLAWAGIIWLALWFAFQDSATNFISGIMMAVRRPFEVGDIISTNDIFGTVKKVDLRATTIYTPKGQTVIIPNKKVFQMPIKNYSYFQKRRIDLSVGVSYGENLSKVKDITIDAINSLDFLSSDSEVELFYEEFGDSSINFVVRYWIDFSVQVQYKNAVSEGIMSIKAAYDENDITIPFPIRTLDFGIKGGEKLSDMMSQ